MQVIYKYNLNENNVITAPFSQILDCQVQNGEIMLWAVVDDEATIVGTGWPHKAFELLGTYFRTVQQGALIKAQVPILL